MNMRKTLPLLVIASMMLSLVPSSLAVSLTISLSSTFGNIGDKVTVSGTLLSYNGRYWIIEDQNKDSTWAGYPALAGANVSGADYVWGPFTANGYSYSQEIAIQDSTYGASKIWVVDEQSSGQQSVFDYFTVQTSYTMDVDKTYTWEGGPVVAIGAIKGAPAIWTGDVDLRIKITNPSGATTIVANATNIVMNMTIPGRLSVVWNSGAKNDALGCNNGVFTATLEQNVTNTWTLKATDTFTVGILEKNSYMRTETINVLAKAPATNGFTKVELKDPSGVAITTIVLNVTAGQWMATSQTLLLTIETTTMGTYTATFYNGATVVKTQSVLLDKAYFNILQSQYLDTSVKTGSVAIGAEVERMHTIKAVLAITYPGGGAVGIEDLQSGFTAYIYYNDTQVTQIALDPLVGFTSPNLWTISYKIPKNAVVGKGYHVKVLTQSLTDAYGNAGPKEDFNTTKFAVIKCNLYTGATPLLVYPGAGNNIQRTLEAKATFDVRYPDDSRVTGTDFGQFNVTLDGTITDYNLQMAASNYLDTIGIWMATWKSPYNATLGSLYTFSLFKDDVEDLWGNHGPVNATSVANSFGLAAATITISEVGTNAPTYLSDQEVTVSWKATYPSGDSVTTKGTGYNILRLYDSNGNNFANVTGGSYNAATGKWSVKYLLPLTLLSGTYNATIKVDMVQDDATTPNKGPTSQKYANFDITRISLLDIYNLLVELKGDVNATNTQLTEDVAKALAAAEEAKAAATTAGSAADSAATAAADAKSAADAATAAANAAKTAADAAGTTATAAKSAADAATAAANAAKTAAEAAKASAEGQTTLIYAAIGASLVAAIAAIVALMQISRKIA